MKINTRGVLTFEQIGDLADDVYFIYDTSASRFSYIGPSFEKVWSRSHEAYVHNAEALIETVHPEDRTYVLDFIKRAYHEHKTAKIEFRILHGEDVKKYILLKVFPLTDNSNQHFIAAIATDITVTKSNILYAEKINARKNSTLEVLAHDLKTPIGMINMMAAAIQQLPKVKTDDTIVKYVELIQGLCKRNIELIRDIVNQEFLESAQVDLRKERADIVFGISDIIENYKRSSDIIMKEFRLSSTAEKLYLQFDTLKLMQVFNNLISNAIKFTYDNGIIEVDITEEAQSVRITVRDNGIGIPEEMHAVLFEKFTPARRVGLKGEKPVGLGMSIIKTIVELHGGQIWFDSQVNIGSTFYITIPK
jgi:two-component system sensor histidine kinase VicK